MSRRSYREHRAQRAQAMSDDGTDRDSIASFSTFASHTSFGSVAYTPYSSFSAAGQAGSSPYLYGASLAPPVPMSQRQRTYSNISSMSSNHLRPREPSLSPAPATGTPTPRGGSPAPDKDTRERDKRRRRAKNEERWRRVRAREAAHDAPVRRVARFAHSKMGTKGVMAATLFACLVVRVGLAALVLSVSAFARDNVAEDVAALIKLCGDGRSVAPVLRPLLPVLCRAIGPIPEGWPGVRAAGVVIFSRVVLESVLWSAALAWATVEGWREGRTLRTRVAAVVYLSLAPVLALSDAAVLPVRAGLGLTAWALVATCSGHDGVAAVLMAAAVWSGRYATVYLPGFIVYAMGKRFWLGRRGAGYLARLVVSAAFGIAVLEALGPAPLRERLRAVIELAKSATPVGLLAAVKATISLLSIRNVLSILSLLPSTYLTLKASAALAPKPNEKVTSSSVPATARMLPLALTATAGAMAVWPADAALPLLPLAFASALRRDDDEWAVAVQAHHVAAINLWSKIPAPLLPLAGGYMLAWSWLIGARRDAPSLALRVHQWFTTILSTLALFAPMIPPHALLSHAHTVFLTTSVAALVIWANVRLVKTAWAVGAL